MWLGRNVLCKSLMRTRLIKGGDIVLRDFAKVSLVPDIGPGKPLLKAALVQAAHAVAITKGTYLADVIVVYLHDAIPSGLLLLWYVRFW